MGMENGGIDLSNPKVIAARKKLMEEGKLNPGNNFIRTADGLIIRKEDADEESRREASSKHAPANYQK